MNIFFKNTKYSFYRLVFWSWWVEVGSWVFVGVNVHAQGSHPLRNNNLKSQFCKKRILSNSLCHQKKTLIIKILTVFESEL